MFNIDYEFAIHEARVIHEGNFLVNLWRIFLIKLFKMGRLTYM